MKMVNDIIAKILDFGTTLSEALGMFFVPVILLSAIALVLFARNSYKLLKFVLPIAGMAAGAAIGATYVAPLLDKAVPVLSQYVSPVYLTAAVLGLVLGLLCVKYHTFAVLLITATVSYLFLGRIVKDLLLSIPFILQIANDVIRMKSYTVGIIVCIITTIIVTFLVHRYFKKVYVFVTSIGVCAATLGIAAVLVFQPTDFTTYAAMAATALGLVVGTAFCYKQLGDVYIDL